MDWQPYRLVYQAKSPIHIGYRTLGFIQRTRYYIPGRALWGAITANLTRAYGSYEQYGPVGEDVKSSILFSYFYPAPEPDKPLLPCFTADGLMFASPDGKQRLSQGDFRCRGMHSCVGGLVGAFCDTVVPLAARRKE